MFNNKVKKALIKVAKKLNKNNLNWVLIGSTSHFLQGMKEENFNDIDVIVELSNLKQAEKIFSDYKASSITKLRKGEFKLTLKIQNIPIEIIGERKASKYFSNQEEFIVNKKFQDTSIPCRKIEKDLIQYKKLNRKDKVKKIKKFLDQQKL